MLRTREAFETAFTQRVDRDDRGTALRAFAQFSQHPRMVRRRILAEEQKGIRVLEILERHGSLAHAHGSGRPRLVASWHMFEQSGKLLVPYMRTNNWYRNA